MNYYYYFNFAVKVVRKLLELVEKVTGGSPEKLPKAEGGGSGKRQLTGLVD
jgi:hypothetical protein